MRMRPTKQYFKIIKITKFNIISSNSNNFSVSFNFISYLYKNI